MAEETPGNSVLIMCTTDPTKLDKGLIDRAECYALSTLSPTEISSYVSYICTLMGMPLDEKVIELVTEQSQGKPRRALKGLQKAINIGFDHIDDIKEVLALDEEVDKDVLDEIYTPSKKKWRHGVVPDYAIDNIKTHKTLYVEVKRQDGWVEGKTRSDGRGNPRGAQRGGRKRERETDSI